MANALNLSAPKYVCPADWQVAEHNLGNGLPRVKRTGTYVTSQATLDALVTEALARNLALVYLDLPPMGFNDSRLQNPNAFYPTPALLAEIVEQVGEVLQGVNNSDTFVAGRVTDVASATRAALEGLFIKKGLFFRPEDYGAVGDGVTDDTVALQNCLAAALAVSGTMLLSAKTYGLSAELQFVGTDAAVTLVGMGQESSVIKALSANAGLSWGQIPTGPGTTGVTVFGRPSLCRDFKFDGNQIANLGIKVAVGVSHAAFANVWSTACFGDGWLVGTQNAVFTNCIGDGNKGNGLTIDYGAQAIVFVGCHFLSNDGWSVVIRQSGGPGWGASAQPQNILFSGGITEQGGSPYFADTGLGGVWVREGVDIVFDRFDLWVTEGTAALMLTPGTANGAVARITVRDCRVQKVYLNANSGGVAGGMGGFNEPILFEGWNVFYASGIVNGSTAPVYISNLGPVPAYTPEGTGATPALVPLLPKMVGCRLKLSANAAAAGAFAVTLPPWDVETYDTHGFHTGSSSDVIIPAGQAGYYDISASVAFTTAPAAGQRILVRLLVDGVAAAVEEVGGDGTTVTAVNISGTALCNAGSVVRVWIQISGAALTISQDLSRFAVTKVARS